MQRLHKAPLPLNYPFPQIEDWLSTIDKNWEIPSELLDKARNLKKQLLLNSYQKVLLHGDLHHDNILLDENEWSVIDPKGVIGYPINGFCSFIVDPIEDTEYIAKYFGFDLLEVRQWYFVHLILSASWNFEDNIEPNHFLDLAKRVFQLV
jgi:streptomycin 6-kinase